MITLKDCEAFCDADPGWVKDLACRERLSMVQAYARAQECPCIPNDLEYFSPKAPGHEAFRMV